MADMEQLKRAKYLIDALAQGVNPATGQMAEEDTVLNQPEVIRGLFFVSDLLRSLMDEAAAPRSSRSGSKLPFFLTEEMRSQIVYSPQPLPISGFLAQFQEMRDASITKKLPATAFTRWLLEKDMLSMETSETGRIQKMPTPLGVKLGIRVEHRFTPYGGYDVLLYDSAAQHFLVEHMNEILDFYYKK